MNSTAIGLMAVLSWAGCSSGSEPAAALVVGARKVELLYTNDLDGEIEPCG